MIVSITLLVISCILVFYIVLKLYSRLTQGIYRGNERLDGKTIIVTGASSGLGLESAKDFAERGARVLMLCRDMVKGEIVRKTIASQTSNYNLVLKHIDFSNLSSVRKCAAEILSQEPRIDVLLNNAGAFAMGPHLTQDGMEILMQSNHFGPFLFTNILLGRIKESTPSRIVNVSSVAYIFAVLDLDKIHEVSTNDNALYASSKLANIYFTTYLADRLNGSGVTVNCLNPGVAESAIARNGSIGAKIFRKCVLGIVQKGTWEGAQTQIMACVSDALNNVTGLYFSDCKVVSLTTIASDPSRAEKLWDISAKAVKLQENEKHF